MAEHFHPDQPLPGSVLKVIAQEDAGDKTVAELERAVSDAHELICEGMSTAGPSDDWLNAAMEWIARVETQGLL